MLEEYQSELRDIRELESFAAFLDMGLCKIKRKTERKAARKVEKHGPNIKINGLEWQVKTYSTN